MISYISSHFFTSHMISWFYWHQSISYVKKWDTRRFKKIPFYQFALIYKASWNGVSHGLNCQIYLRLLIPGLERNPDNLNISSEKKRSTGAYPVWPRHTLSIIYYFAALGTATRVLHTLEGNLPVTKKKLLSGAALF